MMASILFPINHTIDSKRPFVLDGLATDFVIHKVVRREGPDSCFWLQTRQGSGMITWNNQKIAVMQGQGVWINPGQAFELEANPEGWTVDWLSLSGSSLDCLFRSHPVFSQTSVFHLIDETVLHDHFTAILANGQDYTRAESDHLSLEAYSCILAISQQISDRPVSSRGIREQRLKPVLDHIAEHFRESITLEVLSQVMGVTPQHLCTVFRKLMGQRIFEYINQIRIQFSKADLIEHPEKSVKAVANDCGFDDVSYFCSIFKRFEKITPGDFRKLYHA